MTFTGFRDAFVSMMAAATLTVALVGAAALPAQTAAAAVRPL